jgi:hypothetical protein
MHYSKLMMVIGAATIARATEDYDTDIANAQIVSDSVQNLANAISITEDVFKTADKVVGAITEVMAKGDPVFAVLGFVTSMAKIFVVDKQYKEILNQLSEIQAQIAFL